MPRSAFCCHQLPAALLQSPLCRCLSLPSELNLMNITWASTSQNVSLVQCLSQRQPLTLCRIELAMAQTICNLLALISLSNKKYISCRTIILWKQIGMLLIKSQAPPGPPLPKRPAPSAWKCKCVPVWINLPDKLKKGCEVLEQLFGRNWLSQHLALKSRSCFCDLCQWLRNETLILSAYATVKSHKQFAQRKNVLLVKRT